MCSNRTICSNSENICACRYSHNPLYESGRLAVVLPGRILEHMKRINGQSKKVRRPKRRPTGKSRIDACLSSKSVEWNTPRHIAELAVSLLGTVDLDPCSDSLVNPNISPKKWYTKADDGLSKTWCGRVFLNPPYGREIQQWVERLDSEYRAGHVREAIALLPARTDTAWFRVLRRYPKCFVNGRLTFGNAKNTAPFPSVIVYLGTNPSKFLSKFEDVGDIYVLMKLDPQHANDVEDTRNRRKLS